MKQTTILCLCLSITCFALACNENQDSGQAPSRICFDRPSPESVYVVDGSDYVTALDDSLTVVKLKVLRTNMAQSAPLTVGVEVSGNTISETLPLPADAYSMPGELHFGEGQQSADVELTLDIRGLHRNDRRDNRYSLELRLVNPSAFEVDGDRGSVRILLDTEKFLKEQGLYYNWTLDFSDDFDGTGTMENYNTEWWGQTNSVGHGGVGYRRAETITRQDGVLVCGTYRDPAFNNEILSSHMYHRKNYLYARIEFMVRIDQDPNELVGGVLLTWPNNENGKWPRDGELDIYETFGTSPSPHTFIHYGEENATVNMRHPVLRDEWTRMAIEWTRDELRLYRNGKHVWTITDPRAIPSVPHYFAIQSGVASAEKQDSYPADARINMYVDWVRIYTPAE